MSIRIVADSTCDLSKELIEKYKITIIPLSIIMGDESHYDGEDLTPEEIFEWSDRNRTTPKTSAVSQERTEKVLRPMMNAGDDIIFFGISGKMSSTCNVVSMVGADYDKLHVIDSMNLSTGIGLQVIRAAEFVAAGLKAPEIVERINKAREDVRASFVIDTLTYLSRGGRCSSVTALLAGTLKLHPEIVVKDGAMSVNKKYRGSLGNSVMKYATDLEEALLDADHDRVFITHTVRESERAIVDEVRKYLESLGVFKEVIETKAGGVISSHCGPGTLGILFIK